MFAKYRSIFMIGIMAAGCAVNVVAQDDRILPKPDDPSTWPKAALESKARMLIEESKKEHDTLLRRGDEAVEIAEKIESLAAGRNGLTGSVADKLDNLEKVVKKIRDDLNGDDDEGSELKNEEASPSAEDGFGSLKALVLKLNDELKKTTRFSISAAAIDRSNAVLRMVRKLRGKK